MFFISTDDDDDDDDDNDDKNRWFSTDQIYLFYFQMESFPCERYPGFPDPYIANLENTNTSCGDTKSFFFGNIH